MHFFLQKGGGYHLDLMIVAVLIIICSLFGLPWFVAATVLSINHVRSLTRESETSAPGEKPQFLGKSPMYSGFHFRINKARLPYPRQ